MIIIKSNPKLLYCAILYCIFSIGYGNQVYSQEKLNLSLGIGLPELLNIGTRYQIKQTQLGITIGSLPLNNESIFSVTGSVYYHFAGISKLSIRRLWYGRVGLNYFREEPKSVINEFLYLNLQIGRDINISKKFGIDVNGGLIVELFHKKIRKTPPGEFDFNFEIPIFPSIGIDLFYRL